MFIGDIFLSGAICIVLVHSLALGPGLCFGLRSLSKGHVLLFLALVGGWA